MWDVKEPKHYSKRVGREVPGVVAVLCVVNAGPMLIAVTTITEMVILYKYVEMIRIVLAKLIIKTQRLLFVRFGTIIHNDFFRQQFRGKQYYSFPACVDTSDMHKRSKNYNK